MPKAKTSIKKEERLLNLFCALLATSRPLSYQEISEKINGYRDLDDAAARRQFERDKSDLRALGVSIEQKQLPRETAPGYYIDKNNYYLKDIDLTAGERVALNLFLGLFKVGDVKLEETVFKLGGKEDASNSSNDPFGMIWLDFDRELPKIQRAISNGYLMEFDYITEEGNSGTRHLKPQALYLKESKWHVSGFDTDKKAQRNFRLDRVQGDINFKKPKSQKPISPNSSNAEFHVPEMPWEYGDGDPNEATLLTTTESAKWVAEELGKKAKATTKEDGTTLFKFSVTSPIHFYRLVAGFGKEVEVLGDETLRQGFIDYLKAII